MQGLEEKSSASVGDRTPIVQSVYWLSYPAPESEVPTVKSNERPIFFLIFQKQSQKTVIFVELSVTFRIIQSDRKVKQSIFFYGCNSIQFDWINKHTISLWLYKSLRRSRDVVTCSCQSVSCLQTVCVKDVFFASATSVHCRKLPGISFLLNLPEWV
jgi:hypothetical protein